MTVSLNKTGFTTVDDLDNVVIRNVIDTIPGGRALNVTGYTPDVIKAGHVIIKDSVSGDFKPMPVTAAGAYDSLPASHSYVGVCVSSIRKDNAACSIMIRGTLNTNAVPYSMSSILSDFKTACPHILCTTD